LDVDDFDALFSNPVIGNSWEGYVIEQIYAVLPESYTLNYYRTQQGSELDLVICKNLKPFMGIEIKYNSSPKFSIGNEISLQDLGLEKCYIVVPEIESYLLKPNVEVICLNQLLTEIIKI
jgi:predicted AAA+ superfamily ATPase